jgi:hypothetical protein
MYASRRTKAIADIQNSDVRILNHQPCKPARSDKAFGSEGETWDMPSLASHKWGGLTELRRLLQAGKAQKVALLSTNLQ